MPIAERDPISVTALVSRVKGVVDPTFTDVWVAGELSQFTRAASGHIYLTLKDGGAAIKGAMWRSLATRLKFDPIVGNEVIAHGKIDVYLPSGEFKLIVDHLEPKGVGAAELALRQLKEKLLKKGYFSPDHKRPLPTFPKRIGIVSSATGAAVRDILELLAGRWPLAEVVVRHSRVQGAGAGAEIAAAVRELSALHSSGALRFDALIVGRGGGSADDLSCFNDEAVADALFVAPMPIVSAVGHEIDVSIADLVADARAETPSAAVTLLTPDRTDLMAGLLGAATRLRSAGLGYVARGRERIDRIQSRVPFRKPFDRLRDREQRLDDATARLVRGATVRVGRAKDALAAASGRLDGLSPLNVLTRGYSLTTNGGTVVRDAATLDPGDEMTTRFAAGVAVSVVKSVRSIT